MTHTPTSLSVYHICRDVAANIGTANTVRVAQLLFGTAAHESHFKYRRQHGYEWSDQGGAFGLWQIEPISVRESVRRLSLSRKSGLAAGVGKWLYGQEPPTEWYNMHPDAMHAIQSDDRRACLFARLHYMWIPDAIPATVFEQAAYWDVHYNRCDDHGTAAEYMESWAKYAKPVWEEMEAHHDQIE